MKLTIWMLCGEVSREQEQKRKGQLGESGGSSSWDVCLGLPPGGGGGGKGWRLGRAGRARQTGSADGPGGKCGRYLEAEKGFYFCGMVLRYYCQSVLINL